ncbi:hypothetical protein RSAG8_05400, partial [Rhizoctonia solani AG-8 WAC10335]
MNRHFRRVDGTIPVAALLYEDEELVASQDSVGLYDGKEKTPHHQNGVIHITSHRLIYIDNIHPRRFSTSCNLSRIKQTDVYAGFLKSSPKVILYLSAHEDKDNSNPEVIIRLIYIDNIHPRRFSTSCNLSRIKQTDVYAGFLKSSPKVILYLSAHEDKDNSNPEAIPSTSNGEDEELELEGGGKEGWLCPICSYNNPPSASDSSAPVCVLCGVPKNDDIPMPQQFRSVRTTKATRPALDIPTASSLPSSSAVSTPTSPVAPNGEIACPACTFFNHPSMTHCEICSTPLGNVVLRSSLCHSNSASSLSSSSAVSTPTSPVAPNGEIACPACTFFNHPSMTHCEICSTPLGNVVSGYVPRIADYAKLLNQKLTQQEEADRRRRDESGLPSNNDSAPSDSETTFIRSSLARLGLPTDAVTQDMVADEKAYHQELAKELGGLLLGGYGGKGGKARESEKRGSGILKDSRGIVGLDEVWGAWNRARGVALLPPSTLLSVVPLLPTYTTPPIHMRTLRSGLRVLHSPDYTREAFAGRIDSLLRECFPVGRTTFQIAVAENEGAPGSQSRGAGLQNAAIRNGGAGVSLAMVQEMIECAEEDGAVVRDLGLGEAGELRWLPNLFVGYVWDGD